MHEFWSKDKLILLVGLFQFGLVIIVMAVVNLIKLAWFRQNTVDTDSQNEIEPVSIALSNVSEVESDQPTNQSPNELNDAVINLNNHEITPEPSAVNLSESDRIHLPEQDQLEVIDLSYKVDIAPELLTELKEISDNPAIVIDEAIRWWLRRRTLDVLDAADDRPDRIGMRSNRSRRSAQELWND